MLTDDDGGMMKPLLQIEHAAINAIEYPGTTATSATRSALAPSAE